MGHLFALVPQPHRLCPRKNRTARNTSHPAASTSMPPTITGSSHPLAINGMHEFKMSMTDTNSLLATHPPHPTAPPIR